MSAGAQIDYDVLARKYGGSASQDYASLAAKYGGTAQQEPAETATIGPAPKPTILQRAERWWTAAKPYGGTLDRPGTSPQEKVHDLEKGVAVASIPALVASGIAAPIATMAGIGGGAIGGYIGAHGGKKLGERVGAPELGEDIGATAGSILGGGIGAAGSKAVTGLALPAIRNAAMEEPDVAALKAMKIGIDTRRAQPTLENINIARPYLKGVQTQEEAQAALQNAEREVYGPRQEVLDKYGEQVVAGPDGPTRASELEAERTQLSALNRALKKGRPEALQLAQQKGMTQAELLNREADINSALDPFFENHGINSPLTRRTYAALADLREDLRGRLGGMQRVPVGLGKLARGTRIGVGVGEGGEVRGMGGWLTEPIARFGQAARDIAAGRGLWSASPSDLAIKEGFRVGGEKPVLTTTPERIAGLLPPGSIRLGSNVEPVELPEQTSTPLHAIQRNTRTGRMQRVYLTGGEPREIGHTAEGGPIYPPETPELARTRAMRGATRMTPEEVRTALRILSSPDATAVEKTNALERLRADEARPPQGSGALPKLRPLLQSQILRQIGSGK